jgi:hypothetical protein
MPFGGNEFWAIEVRELRGIFGKSGCSGARRGFGKGFGRMLGDQNFEPSWHYCERNERMERR